MREATRVWWVVDVLAGLLQVRRGRERGGGGGGRGVGIQEIVLNNRGYDGTPIHINIFLTKGFNWSTTRGGVGWGGVGWGGVG